MSLSAVEIQKQFEEAGALLTGHFKLSSGRHADRYLQCALVLQWPERASLLGTALGETLAPFGVSAALSPAMGGLIIGHEVGRALGRRAIFVERVEGVFQLRRGFALAPGERVAVVEDVVTTGRSTREVVEVVEASGARVVACASIVDRRTGDGSDALDGIPYRALWRLDVPSWSAEGCPLCRDGTPLTAPGSRGLAGTLPSP